MQAVIIDLTEVEFIDACALGVLVQGHHLACRVGAGYVVATHPMIHTLCAVTGPATVLPMHPDLTTTSAALALVNPPTAV